MAYGRPCTGGQGKTLFSRKEVSCPMKRFWIGIVLLLAGVGLVVSAHAQQIPGSLAVVSGVVAQVSTGTNGSLESATVNTTFGVVDLTFTTESKLRVLGDTQLQPGDRIVAIVSGSGEVLAAVALHIQVSPSSTVKGTIVAVDATQGTITLEVKKPRGGTTSLVLKVTSETTIRKDGKAVEISALAKGDIAEVTFRLRDNVALRIEAHSPPPPPPQLKIVRGTLSADVGADGSLRINLKGGGSVSAQVTEGSRIIVKGEGQGGNEDLVAGSEVVAILQIDASGKVVVRQIVVEKPKPLKAMGTIHALADDRLILELKVGGFMEFEVNDKTEILLDDRSATLADLKQGMKAIVFYKAEAGVNLALRIEAESPKPEKVRGIVTEVVADATLGQKITLAVQGDVNHKMTFVVTSDTKIEVDGKEASLDQVIIGSEAEVLFRVEGNQNIALEVVISPKPKKVEGVLQAVSSDQLTLKTKEGVVVQFKLTSETQITLDGKPASVSDLKAGQEVVVTFLVQGEVNTALKVEAETPEAEEQEVKGTVTAVSSGSITLAVQGDLSQQMTFVVNNLTEIKIGGRKATLQEITVGSPAVVEFVVQGDQRVATEVKIVGQSAGGLHIRIG